MIRKISLCDKCGSNKIEDWAEFGHWWVHCHNCNWDHAEDDAEVDKADWRGFDDEVLDYSPIKSNQADEWSDLLGDE